MLWLIWLVVAVLVGVGIYDIWLLRKEDIESGSRVIGWIVPIGYPFLIIMAMVAILIGWVRLRYEVAKSIHIGPYRQAR